MLWSKPEFPNHLPLHEGPFVPGCIDVMTGFGADGTFMRLWYPTSLNNVKSFVSKWPKWMADDRYIVGFASVVKLWPCVMKLAHTFISDDMHIPAVWAADPVQSHELPRMPVIVLTHGLGACRFFYSTLCLQLASFGYFVAAIEHRDESSAATYFYNDADKLAVGKKTWLPFRVVNEGGSHLVIRRRQLALRTQEVSRALDVLLKINEGHTPCNLVDNSAFLELLQGRLDFDKPTLMGHSFGGATALLTAASEKRFKQLVILDSWLFGLKNDTELSTMISELPKIFINTETFQMAKNLAVMRKFVNKTDSSFTIKGTTHEHQCDSPLLLGLWLNLGMTKLDPVLGGQINVQLVLRFLKEQIGFPMNWDNNKYLEEQTNHICPAISIYENDTPSKL